MSREIQIPVPQSIDGYRQFLKIRTLPRYRFVGHVAYIPAEYASEFGVRSDDSTNAFRPRLGLFDYQAAITELAIRKRKFAVFAAPGMGKTLILLEWARYLLSQIADDQCILLVAPLMVSRQIVAEAKRFYGDELPLDLVRSKELPKWLDAGGKLGITNYEAIRDDLPHHRIAAMGLDESSILKSHYGETGQRLLDLGRGVEWKLCLTGTPAPNDRIEYATHAVFLDQFPTINAFLARFFVNRGQTENRWELKPHALRPFYRSLSHWSIFLNNPAVYGWKDNVAGFPPVHYHHIPVDLTEEQRALSMQDFGQGTLAKRSATAQLAKGFVGGKEIETNRYPHFDSVVNAGESTIIWCKYNPEQDAIRKRYAGRCSNITGSTPEEVREYELTRFLTGDSKILVSKPKILGFGLNLQIATKMIFSTCQDSLEDFYQAVKRANRYGSTMPLDVYIPATELELPMVENVFRKMRMMEADIAEQESLFKELMYAG